MTKLRDEAASVQLLCLGTLLIYLAGAAGILLSATQSIHGDGAAGIMLWAFSALLAGTVLVSSCVVRAKNGKHHAFNLTWINLALYGAGFFATLTVAALIYLIIAR
jgi:hypothetical protein